jgi:hypothetical protein
VPVEFAKKAQNVAKKLFCQNESVIISVAKSGINFELLLQFDFKNCPKIVTR